MAELRRHVHKYTLPIPYISLLSFLESIYNVFRVRTIGEELNRHWIIRCHSLKI